MARASSREPAWALFGLVTSTRSISGFLMAFCQSLDVFLKPQRLAKVSFSSTLRPTTVCMTACEGSWVKNLLTLRKALEWARPMNLLPIRQMFVVPLGMDDFSRSLGCLECLGRSLAVARGASKG